MTRRDPDQVAKVRLFVPDDLVPGAEVALKAGQAHYLLRVMRLSTGEAIRLFNGRDGEWLGRIETAGRAAASVGIERRIRAQETEYGPWLAFAPVKKSATDYIVEKATELGASRLLPVVTERTVAQRVNVERLRAIAIEAAEQCGRLSVPDLAAPVGVSAFVATWPPRRPLLIAHPRAEGPNPSLLDALARPRVGAAPGLPATPPGFLIGPEGGLGVAELDSLSHLPCAKVVSLGPRILRAETAAAAVLAVWQATAEARRGDETEI